MWFSLGAFWNFTIPNFKRKPMDGEVFTVKLKRAFRDECPPIVLKGNTIVSTSY